jgi:hypothetical protein
MLQKFLISTLLSNAVYLGYHKKFGSSNMFIDLSGLRFLVDLHNINHTLFNFKKLLSLFSSVWSRFGLIWVIGKLYINTEKSNSLHFILNLLFLQTKPWVSGFFTNSSSFLRAGEKFVKFPACLFYANYTRNSNHFNEARFSGLIQTGVADTNSLRFKYNYLINANEKSRRSYLYFFNTLVLFAFRNLYLRKKAFLFAS